MSVARPAARSLALRLRASAAAPSRTTTAASSAAPRCRHQFHSSAQLEARRRPRFKSIMAEDMGLVTPEAVDKFTKDKFPEFSVAEKASMKERYTPEQLAAIEAGEKITDPRDLTVQGRLRVDPYRLRYIDDFSKVAPVVDKRVKRHPTHPVPDAKFMTQEEFGDDFIAWLQGFAPKDVDLSLMSDEQLAAWAEEHGPSDLDVTRYFHERSSLTDGGAPQNTALAPALPDKVPGVAGLYKQQVDPEDEGAADDDGYQAALKRATGMTLKQLKNIKTRNLVTRYVTNQTRLGKVQTWSVLSIAGNGDGWLGIGVAKSPEMEVASSKSKLLATQNMRPIRRYENRTIYGDVTSKISGTVVELRSRPPGFGLRVPHRIFEMCRMAGIHDLAAHFPRSRNPMNTVKAAFMALTDQHDPEQIAIGRGKKMVDVRKVYYGGAVY